MNFSIDELHRALGAFLIGFGETLPPDLAQRIRSRVFDLSDQIERHGEPTVARLARGLADSLAAQPSHRERT